MSSTRIGAPPAALAASERVSANLSPGDANRVASSPRPAARKLSTNAFDSKNAGKLADRLSRQKSTSGGSSDTAQTALLVNPRGVPSLAIVVTIVTPVGNDPTTALNSCPSTPKGYFAGGGAPTVGTQIGARHCMPAAQSPGPWHGQ